MGSGIARCLAVVFAISLTAGGLSVASAWVFYRDDRQRSYSTMVGTLTVELPEGKAVSTAVLVDGCGILTNFHAVFGPWYVTALRAPSREFPGTFTLTEATRPDGTLPSARAIPVVWGDYRGPDRHWRIPHHDWAYLVLEQCLGLYGHFVLRDLDLDEPAGAIDGFAAIGYSTGQQMIDPVCSLQVAPPPGGNRGWRHDCALDAGDSGGPILRRGTLTLVALGMGSVADPGGCPSGRGHLGGAPLARWTMGCANLAVPLTRDIIERVEAAHVAVAVQRALDGLGYDAGALGAIDDPRASAAIRQVQREMGWAVTGEPGHPLLKILLLRLKLMVG
jgi:hypothetical protein